MCWASVFAPIESHTESGGHFSAQNFLQDGLVYDDKNGADFWRNRRENSFSLAAKTRLQGQIKWWSINDDDDDDFYLRLTELLLDHFPPPKNQFDFSLCN